MGVLNDNTIIGASAAGDYEIKQSLRFNDDDSAYLSRTPSVAGNRKTWTWSGWHKRGNVDSDTALFAARTDLDNRIVIYFNSSIGTFNLYTKISAATAALVSTAVYRDASAWYHITVAFDTTQATASNRIKVYVNGEEIALTGAYLAQNADTEINNTVSNLIGISDSMGGNYADGYLAEVNFIDGLALTPDSFGETGDYGEWKPLKYTGAYGTNGFIQEFKDSGDLGKDTSGNGNDFTPTNLAATDQMLDSPTNNFCTLNPLHIVGTVLSEGNVKSTATGVAGGCASQGTIGILNTKTYFEVLVVSNSGGLYIGTTTTAGTTPLVDRGSGICFGASSQIIEYGAFVTYGAAWVVGDIIGVSVDSVNGTMEFFINNVGQGTITNSTISSKYHYPFDIYYSSTGSSVTVANFGQDSSFAGNKVAQGNSDSNGIGDFYYAPPAGFLALCTQNLPDATVVPSEHFNTVLYTGTGVDNHAVTGVGFTPDWVWDKERSSTSSHMLTDIVRDVGEMLYSNSTDAEYTGNDIKSFDSDGFTTSASNATNQSGQTYVAWNWKANGAGVSNTDGTITSTVSANVDAGFSIVSWVGGGAASGTSVGHGLSQPPEILILKSRDSSASYENDWITYTTAVDGTLDYLRLNTTAAKVNSGFAVPTSSVFTPMNADVGDDVIGYAFHSVDGYSKVGSYTGNGSTDGTFVHCGFRPAYVMWKRTDAVAVWVIQDTTRDEGNTSNSRIEANSSAAEATDNANIDMLSNGFKMRQPYGYVNGSGATYIYLAFAESPFKYSNAR
tara:strand:+ start:53 stop:2407 length:2355 start_codon:yes stop_codon:yes gene_type:complete